MDSASHTNPGYTAGWKWDGTSRITSGSTRTAPLPENGNKLDIENLDDAGLIFEVDNALPEAVISVTPARVDDESRDGEPLPVHPHRVQRTHRR